MLAYLLVPFEARRSSLARLALQSKIADARGSSIRGCPLGMTWLPCKPWALLSPNEMQSLLLRSTLHAIHQLRFSPARVSSGVASYRASLQPKFRRLARTMASSPPFISFLQSIAFHDPESVAIVHGTSGRHFTYGQLRRDVACERKTLADLMSSGSMKGARVAFLVENSYHYVGTRDHPDRC